MIVAMFGIAATKAPRIDVKAELSVNGKTVPRDRVRMKINAHPTDERMDEIVVNMDIEYKVGDRVIRSTPQVYTKPGSEAVLTLDESTKDEKLVLKVMAK